MILPIKSWFESHMKAFRKLSISAVVLTYSSLLRHATAHVQQWYVTYSLKVPIANDL
jgi:hypothetical protein